MQAELSIDSVLVRVKAPALTNILCYFSHLSIPCTSNYIKIYCTLIDTCTYRALYTAVNYHIIATILTDRPQLWSSWHQLSFNEAIDRSSQAGSDHTVSDVIYDIGLFCVLSLFYIIFHCLLSFSCN